MKKFLAISGLVLALVVSYSSESYASCTGSGYAVGNTGQAAFSGLSTTAADVRGKIWTYTRSVPLTTGGGAVAQDTCPAAGCDFGTTPTVAEGTCAISAANMFYQGLPCGIGGAADYAVLTDLAFASFDGCPKVSVPSNRLAVFAEDNNGEFGLLSLTSNGTGFDVDLVATQPGINKPQPLTSTGNQSGGVWTIDTTWAALTDAQQKGAFFAGHGAPLTDLVTGYRLWIHTKAGAAAPTNLDKSSAGWAAVTAICNPASCAPVAGNTLVSPDNASATITFPATALTNSQWLGISLVFEGGFESDFTGPVRNVVAPTAAGVFANVNSIISGQTATVNWNSNNESGVVSYQVHWSRTATGTFMKVGGTVAPTGSGSAYNVNYRVPLSSTHYFKISAAMTNGSTVWSPVVLAIAGAPGV